MTPTTTRDEILDGKAPVDPTSLDTQGHPAPQLPNPPDPEWAYAYRRAVSDELRRLSAVQRGWLRRAKALRECGLAGVLIECKPCGTRHIVPYRCGARSCPICSRRLAAGISERVAARVAVHDLLMEVEPWDGFGAKQTRSWRHVVLTSRALQDREARFDPDVLRLRVLRVRRAASKFWRSTPWGQQKRGTGQRGKRSRRDTSYVLGQEVAPGGMVHIHMLIFGEFLPQRIIQALWSQALGEEALIWVSTVRDSGGIAKAIREALKYTTKGEKGSRDQTRHAAAVEIAFRNVKRVSVGGALRQIQIDDNEGPGDDGKAADLHDDKKLACICCGSLGPWGWGGKVTPERVAANGGFGFLIPESLPHPLPMDRHG